MLEAGIPQEQSQNDEIALTLPDLGRPERLCAVGAVGKCGIRIQNTEIGARRMTEGITIHEVCDTSDGLSENDGGCHGIRKGQDWYLVLSEIEIGSHAGKDDASLDGHAALPHVGDLKQMIMVVVPVKEEDIPETSANDADKGDGDAEIKDMLMPAAAVLLQKVVGHDASEDDAQREKDSIKTDRKPTDESDILMHGWYSFMYGDRESVMRKQEAFLYRAFL